MDEPFVQNYGFDRVFSFFLSLIEFIPFHFSAAHQQTGADYESLDNSINNRLHQIESDPNSPPYDTVREYAYEGSATSTRSLSSIESTTPNGKDKCASCNSAAAAHGLSLLPNLQNNCNSIAAFRPTVNFKNRHEKRECNITTDI